MLNKILNGEMPTAIFKRMLQDGTATSKTELSELFHNQVPGLGSHASQIIWNWQGLTTSGLPDSYVDSKIIELMREKGYAV
jgi:hypothetical protein